MVRVFKVVCLVVMVSFWQGVLACERMLPPEPVYAQTNEPSPTIPTPESLQELALQQRLEQPLPEDCLLIEESVVCTAYIGDASPDLG